MEHIFEKYIDDIISQYKIYQSTTKLNSNDSENDII